MPTEPTLIGAFGPPAGGAGTPPVGAAPEDGGPPGVGDPGAAAGLCCPGAEAGDAAEDGLFGVLPAALLVAAPEAGLLDADGADPAPDTAGAAGTAAAGVAGDPAVAAAGDSAVAAASPTGAPGATVVWVDGVTPPAA